MKKINLQKIDNKWQKRWEKAKIFESNVDKKRKKFFITIPYPYVNGAPHIGAGFTFIRGETYARFKRMQGFNVLYPQSFHATGEPILGTIERVRKNDKSQIETFKLFGATDKDIKNFVKNGPEFTAKYWKAKWIDVLKMTGFSVDWRRTFITTPMTPQYSRFIEWQYNRLKKKGYVIQGTHPVIWCPNCQSPTGDHDRLKGEGESPIEYVLIKFKLDSGEIIPCGTLRPETIYGVTNLWVNPDVDYVGVKVDGETWIISREAAEKLKDQLKKVEILQEIHGRELIGKFVENPVVKDKIIILPADFVDPTAATGMVMSVPSHAPYDWIGLVDLQKDEEQLKEFELDPIVVKNIKPISLIKTEGFGEQPAIEICQKMNIQNQKEKEKLDEVTALLYKKEFHSGVLKDNTPYVGRKVSEIKDELIREFREKKIVDIMWECTSQVVCRCTTACHVKILENQWFLKFSDQEWKDKVKQCIGQMKFFPEEVRSQFLNTVDWLKEKACTRKTGLGTPLPWDKSWKIETLSDSTIYMAFYTIARIINEKKVDASKLTDEVLDYIFLGQGNPKQLAKKVKLNEKIIKGMHEEFDYFYPVDLRTSGKDLVQNHLTFYLFHHTAIWDDSKYWPKVIGVNGFVNVHGTKMSKSLGNVIPLKDLVEAIGADLVRINIAASNEELNDADWRDESVIGYKSKMQLLFEVVNDLKKAKRKSLNEIDLFLQTKIQEHIKNATENYEVMKFRSASQHALFNATNDLKWYVDRVGGFKNCNKKILVESLHTIIKMISPFVPHMAEEFWEKSGGKGFVSVAEWPKFDEKKIDKNAVQLEEIFKKTIEDLRNVIKLVGKKKNLYLYFVTDKEFDHFDQSLDFIKRQFAFKNVKIFKTNDKKKYDPENKSSRAKFGKPAIYLD
jgi:leucyl-tRNA synthetase